MAISVLLPVKDGGSRDTAVASHSVVSGFTLSETKTADDGSMDRIGNSEELIEGAGFKAHVGVNHEQPVAV